LLNWLMIGGSVSDSIVLLVLVKFWGTQQNKESHQPNINMAAMQKTGGVMDTNVETITSFIMRELKDRELAVFMNAMQASFDYLF
jgi:hypothetical protein